MPDLIAQVLADPAVATVGMAIGFAVVALWIAAAWWAHADATRRTENILVGYIAAAWILLSTPLLLPLSLAVYAFARPQVAAGDRRVKSLIEELGATAPDDRCMACGSLVEAAWVRCPACASWLAAPCAACSRWADVSLELCPWCGEEDRERPFVRPAALDVPASALVPVMATAGDGAASTFPPSAAAPASIAAIDALDDEGSDLHRIDHHDAERSPSPRGRTAWRPGAPTVPRSQRGDGGRIVTSGRRFNRTRLGA